MQVDRQEQRAAVSKFLTAIQAGELQGLLEVLAPDVAMVADGGGLVPTARKPIVGAARVVAFIAGIAARVGEFEMTPVWLNGAPGIRFDLEGEVAGVLTVVVEDGRISRIFVIRNPHKLGRLDTEAVLAR